MEVTGFPTSADIYLELNGKKVAVVQSYIAKATKSSQSVEAFGESEPVGTIAGQNQYRGADRCMPRMTQISDRNQFLRSERIFLWSSASRWKISIRLPVENILSRES